MITANRVRELLDYDPDTGVFRWRVDKGAVKAGDVAGSPSMHGYWKIKIDGTLFLAHRLAWLYVHGGFPSVIDHRDRDGRNNKIANLRIATNTQNQANRLAQKNNKCGFKGVFWLERLHKWQAQIYKGRRQIYIGVFDTPEDAHAAYMRAAVAHFGEFACSDSDQ